MNNNEIDCSRLETAFLKYEELLGNNNEDSPLWYWLFESAIKCNEHKMAEEIIRKMSVKIRDSAIVTLAIESREEKYLEEAIELAYKKIEEGNNLGYHILMEVIKVMAKAGELNEKALKEAKKIPDDTYREKAINIVLVSSSTAMIQGVKILEHSVPGKENEILEKIFHFATTATGAIIAASKG